MHLLLVIVFLLEMFNEYNAQVSGDFVCKDGEEYDMCRSSCEQTCENIRRGIQNSCSQRCIPGCFCRRGLVRADDDTCVPPSECFKYVCGENEEYLDCGSPCALNCTNLHSPIFCTKPCYKGCFCKPNFVRDSRGKCVDPRNCRIAGDMKCPANEEYVNCVNFCNNCFTSEYCRTPYCTSGCDCKPGYFRNTYGQCITEEQCVAEEYAVQQQCGLNEEYTSCVNPCNDCYSRGRCDEYLFNYCTPGCDCKPGFFRNENGICVLEWNCFRQSQPVCPLGEEYYNCVPTCGVTCDTYNTTDMICDTTCNKGCFCKRGFLRRGDGLCVPPSECPARHVPCPAGETFYQCLPTCRTTCRSLNFPREHCSTECKQGCFCQPGFVRNDDGFCVPVSECPFVCGINEEFRTCGSACPATCENFRERNICPQQICLRGCFCKAGFLLGPKGYCIRPRNCPVPIVTQFNSSGFRGRSGNASDDEETTLISTPVVTEPPSNSSNAVFASKNSPEFSEKMANETTSPERTVVTKNPRSTVDTTIEMLTTMVENKIESGSLTTNAANTLVANITERQVNNTTVSCCSGGLSGRSGGVTDDEVSEDAFITEGLLNNSSNADFIVTTFQESKEKTSGETLTTKWVTTARTPKSASETMTTELVTTTRTPKSSSETMTTKRTPKSASETMTTTRTPKSASETMITTRTPTSASETMTTKVVFGARTPILASETTSDILKMTVAETQTESISLTTKT